MSRVLVVAEAPRVGGFRRPWVRRLYPRYVSGYQHLVARACARAAGASVTLLAARDLVDAGTLPAEVARRYYDDEVLGADPAALGKRTRRIFESWWPSRGAEPALTMHGVWLPDVLSVGKAVLIHLEVMEYVGLLERVLDDVKPDRVLLVTGRSQVERLARALAEDRGIPTSAASRSVLSTVLAAADRALRRREERLALRGLLKHVHRPVPAAETRYVFSASTPRHFMMVDPLARAVCERGFSSRVVASTSQNPEVERPLRLLEDAGIPGAYFMDYLPGETRTRLVRGIRPLARRLARRRPPDRSPLDTVLATYRHDTLTRSLARARLYLEAASRILDAHRPAAVVITSDRRMSERALALAARARRIPTLLYWGGAILGRDETNEFTIADRILVLGDHVKIALSKNPEVDPTSLVVLGDPRSDVVRRTPAQTVRRRVFADFSLDPVRPLVVLVSKYVSYLFSAGEKDAFYRTVREATQALDVNVVVKAHPNHESLAALSEEIARWGRPGVKLTRDYDIHRLFGAADVAIMVTSMAGIEAMALGCPVVAVQTPGKDFEGHGMPSYVSSGAVERVDAGDAEALTRTLRRLLADSAARTALTARGRAFAARYVHPVDGALGDRLDSLVVALVKERGR